MKKFLLLLILGCTATAGIASDDVKQSTQQPWYCRWWQNITTTWKSNQIEAVVPVNTWHNRWVYEHQKVHTYNERPWGLGMGKYHTDSNKDRHRLMAIVFQDSHDKPEPTFAYAWQHIFRPDKTFRPSLGFMTGITFRDDYNWVPLPAILPIIGFDIGNFSFENTYIPGLGGNNGNVLFTWITWRF